MPLDYNPLGESLDFGRCLKASTDVGPNQNIYPFGVRRVHSTHGERETKSHTRNYYMRCLSPSKHVKSHKRLGRSVLATTHGSV